MIFSHTGKYKKGFMMFNISYKKTLVAVAATLMATSLMAAEATLVTFEANTTAKASEVNYNFITLEDRINSNGTRLTTAEANISGNTANISGNTANISGNTAAITTKQDALVAYGGTSSTIATLVSDNNYLYPPASVLNFPVSKTCMVSAHVYFNTGSTANAGVGPYFRVAIQRGTVDNNDGSLGFYTGAIAANQRKEMFRTARITVNAEEDTKFGCAILNVQSDFIGDSASCRVSAICF